MGTAKEVIILSYDGVQGTLSASFKSDAKNENISSQDILQLIIDQGYPNLFPLESGIDDLLASISDNSAVQVIIAEKRDATLEIKVSQDSLTVYATTTKAYGGNNLTSDIIAKALADKKIVYGIDEEAIQFIVSSEYVSDYIVAQGVAAIQGNDTIFKSLIEEVKDVIPKEDEQGNIDFKNVNELLVVKSGDKLMQKIPHSMGSAGKNVYGLEIIAIAGRELDFPNEILGASKSETDPDLLVATTTGHPVVLKDHVRVDPTYVLEKVDLETGNVDFAGSLLIKGNIETGMVVKAGGDITINGSVRRSEIQAGGNIVIKNGIIGGELKTINKKEQKIKVKGTSITCDGNLSAQYIDSSFICSGGDITVSDYVAHSELIADDSVTVGLKSGRGSIIGGQTHAGVLVIAKNIGSQANILTKISVGISMQELDEYDNLLKDLVIYDNNLKILSDAFIKMGERESKGPLNKKSKQVIQNLVGKLQETNVLIRKLSDRRRVLEQKINNTENAKVQSLQAIYTGCQVIIGQKFRNVESDLAKGSFQLQKEIDFHPH